MYIIHNYLIIFPFCHFPTLPLALPFSFPSNKKGAGILDRAANHKISCKYLPVGGRSREAYDEEVSGCLKKAGVQLVLMVRSYLCVKEVSIFSKETSGTERSVDCYISSFSFLSFNLNSLFLTHTFLPILSFF